MNRSKRRLLIVAVSAIAIATGSAQAARWFVDFNHAGNGNGQSWATAFNNLTSGIAAANGTTNDEIWVADGIYKPTSFSASFTLKAGVRILGGFNGPGDDDESDRNPNPLTNSCVLSGDVDDDNILNGDTGTNPIVHHNCYHVVVAPTIGTMEPDDTVLDGFSITMGFAAVGAAVDRGGGILLDNGPLIRNCRVHNNFAGEGGGGIYIDENASPVIRNSIVEDNFTASDAIGGGGIFILDDSSANSTPVRILNTSILDNTAPSGGGILAVDLTHLKVLCCTFSDNTATGVPALSAPGDGGGLRVFGPSGTNTKLAIVNCLFTGNDTGTMSNRTGGGISLRKGIFEVNTEYVGVVNCTFAANVADLGGAYYQANTASSNDMVIANSILWDNGTNEVRVDFGDLTIRESDVNGGSGAATFASGASITYDASNINGDPLYTGGHHLQCGSPCINTADTNLATIPNDADNVDEDADTSEKTPDRDLATRVVANIPDMGCYEVAPVDQCLGDLNGDDCVTVLDLLLVINGWGPCASPPPAACPGDASGPCHGSGDGEVNVSDLLTVINQWGTLVCGCGTHGESLPQSYNDCANLCSGYSGSAWQECMLGCFKVLCEQGQTEFCED